MGGSRRGCGWRTCWKGFRWSGTGRQHFGKHRVQKRTGRPFKQSCYVEPEAEPVGAVARSSKPQVTDAAAIAGQIIERVETIEMVDG